MQMFKFDTLMKDTVMLRRSAKISVKEEFLQFVDSNSQPNGRSLNSTGPIWHFLSTFTSIQTPKHSVKNYE